MAKERGIAIDNLGEDLASGSGANYLLAIGIDKYQHWETLHNAVKDASTFVEVLTRQYQFDDEHVYALYDIEATEANIYKSIRELKRKITPQDNLLIYYSGHGHYDEDFEEGHWVPVEARNDNEDAYISNSDIIKRVNAIDSHHTLVIVDSCFSGSLAVQNRNASVDERFPSRRILASGRHETVSDGKAGEHSPFADGLITYLRKNTSPQLRTTNLIQYVKDQVAIHSKQSPVEGRIPNSSDKGGEFVFHLRRDEHEYWAEIQAKDSVKAYQDYLTAFPTGAYVNMAERRLDVLKEDSVWKTVQLNDNEKSYENYLKKYAPSGKYVQQAQDRLGSLEKERKERERVRQEIAENESEREAMRQQYNQTVAEAEKLFNERQLGAARKKYEEALLSFIPGFVPKQDYIEEQLNLCKTNIEFLRYYDQGKQAADSGNHRLAIQYYQEALKLNDNSQVENLLQHSRAKLRGQEAKADRQAGRQTTRQQTAYQTPVATPAKKKTSRRPLVLGLIGGFILCIVILAVIGSQMEDEPIDGTYSEEYIDQDIYDNGNQTESSSQPNAPITKGGGVNEPITAVPQRSNRPPSNRELVLGAWSTDDVLVNGQSVSSLGDQWAWLTDITFNFQEDGTVWVAAATGSQQYYYQMEGGQFYISDPQYGVGTLDVLNRNRLVFTLPHSQDGGFTFNNMTFQTSRNR